MRKPIYIVGLAVLLQVTGCGEGQEVESVGAETNQEQTESIETAQQDGEQQDQQIQNEFPVIPLEIPALRWSLTAYDEGAGVVEVELSIPDPTWIANDFLTSTIFNPDQKLAAKINCFSYQFEIEATSPTTFRLGLSEPLGLDGDCIPNVPEGMVEAVIGEYENITTDIDDQNRLSVTDGSGVTLFYTLTAIE